MEQTDYIRKQLRKVTAEIVQQPSEYDDSLRYYLNYLDTRVAKSIDIPCRDEARWYVGIRDPNSYTCFVNVLGDDGKEYPLQHCSRAYLRRWGYPDTHAVPFTS